MTDEQLAELERLEQAATRLPWSAGDDSIWCKVYAESGSVAAYVEPPDAALIAAMRNALPDLLAALRREREEREAAERERDAVLGRAEDAERTLATEQWFNERFLGEVRESKLLLIRQRQAVERQSEQLRAALDGIATLAHRRAHLANFDEPHYWREIESKARAALAQ